VMEFLLHYQYELSTRAETQEAHARRGGFCPLHTWHYEQAASPRGVCTAYPRLLNRVARSLRALGKSGSRVSGSVPTLLAYSCPACEVRWHTEDVLIGRMAKEIATEVEQSGGGKLPPLCLPHLELMLSRIQDGSKRRRLLLREAAAMERIAEDMQRCAIKYDALRRDLVSREENDASLIGLQLLTGHRNVNAIFTVREI
jgi:hypothetical protein